jgi:Family of unknown function (DUF6909)
VDAQIFDLSKLHVADIDPRCRLPGLERLARSKAIILNIDYPLGMAAYRMLREVMENLSQMRGIYILGKAATLNGSVGDVMISDVVLDEHSQNVYWLENCFTAGDVGPQLVYGSVLDNQKAVSNKGTFLQNRQYLDFYYRANYTVVEMESGPYLNAVYETLYTTRYPTGENINFARLPFDLGILHYASDTPYTRGKNLGAGSLSYFGMDSTYGAAIAIGRRILSNELSVITPSQSMAGAPASVGVGTHGGAATFSTLTGSAANGNPSAVPAPAPAPAGAAPVRPADPLVNPAAAGPAAGGSTTSSSFLFRPFGKERRENLEGDSSTLGKGEPAS